MTRDDASRRVARRHVLGTVAAAATTAVAGCGYRSAVGDPVWRVKGAANWNVGVDDAVVCAAGTSYDPDAKVLNARTGRLRDEVDLGPIESPRYAASARSTSPSTGR